MTAMVRYLRNSVGIAGMAGGFASVWGARFLGTRRNQLPIVNLYVNRACNSRCVTCGHWKRGADGGVLSADEILGMIPSLKRLGTRIISMAGGEPTLRGDLETIISGLRGAGISVHMDTGAVGLGSERAASLAEAGLSAVYVSCDHCDPGMYRKIRGVDGLEGAAAAVRGFLSHPRPPLVGVSVTVSRLNQDSLDGIVDLCLGWGVRKIQFIPVHKSHGLDDFGMSDRALADLMPGEPGSLKPVLRRLVLKIRRSGVLTNSDFFIEHFDYAYKPLRVTPCLAGYLFINVAPGGEASPCFNFPTGLSVRDTPLERIFRSDVFEERCRSVRSCGHCCMGTGSAETSIRFHLPYLLTHLRESYHQARMHSG